MTEHTHMINLTAGATGAEDWQRLWDKFNEFTSEIRADEQPGYISLTSTLVDESVVDAQDGDVFYDEGTLLRVYEALRRIPMPEKVAREAITAMQNAGILFRERREPPAWTQAHYNTPGV